MKSQIGQWGNSLAFRIPKLIAVELGLKPNDPVQCRVEDGKLVLELVQEVKEYTLDQLLTGKIEQSEEVWWGKAEGDEAW